jgi:AcrR family transcriptional regulator
MPRDAERTKRLLLDAATAEFVEHGIAGARVDRIAAAANVNKAMIYSYFGSKDQLFDAVFSALVVDTVERVPFDATDLPDYAGRLFDSFEDQPETHRLATWYQLERPHGAPLAALVASNKAKLDQLQKAKDAGLLPGRYRPVELLALVRSAAMSWISMTPELGATAPKSRARRRAVVIDAVQRIIASD